MSFGTFSIYTEEESPKVVEHVEETAIVEESQSDSIVVSVQEEAQIEEESEEQTTVPQEKSEQKKYIEPEGFYARVTQKSKRTFSES